MAILLDGTTGISASGNISVGGTLAVGGSFAPQAVSTTGNVQGANLFTAGQVSAAGNISGNYFIGNGALLTSIVAESANSATTADTVTGAAQANITSVGTLTALSVTGNVQGGNLTTAGLISATGAVTASQFNGSGAGLTSIPGANVTGTVANATFATSAGSATTADTVTGAAQANITSVGTLTALSVTGNVDAGNVNATNLTGTLLTAAQTNITSVGTLSALSVTGNVTASQFNGSGAGLTSIPGANVTGTVPDATTAATVTGAAQANITSVGTLTALSVTGNVTSGNLVTAGTVDAASLTTSGNAIVGGDLVVNGNTTYINITDLNVQDPIIGLGRGANNTPLTTDDGKDRGEQLWYYDGVEKSAFLGWDDSVGKLIAAANVTIANEIVTVDSYGTFVVGALEGASASVTGNVTASQFNGSGVGLTSIPGANVTGTVPDATTAATVTGAAQANITSVGTLSSLSVTGNVTVGAGFISIGAGEGDGNIRATGTISASGTITGGSLTVGTGNVTLGSIVNANANGVGNIGSATGTFDTVFAKATSAQYADLAEYYRADHAYTPGTVVVFGGASEVTQSTQSHDSAVAGVVSTDPAYIMNAGLAGSDAVAVALVGRVPCRVTGDINKGDLVVTSSIPGTAQRLDLAQHQPGVVIGKALESHSGAEPGMIEIVVGRH